MESNILLLIQEVIRNPVFTPFFIWITKLGDKGMIWILLALLLQIPQKTRKTGYMLFVALIGSLLINNMLLKNLVGRARPYTVIKGLIPLIKGPVDYSFPSGHTGSSFAAAWVLYRKLPKKYGILAVVLASLIAISRLYVGVHYPSDILFGMISGIGISYIAEIIVNRIYEDNERG